jgi:UDP-N-acetylglucosamine 2-epimerase (non-hydrolysing)
MKKIHLICAARPNFMKVAPLYHALKKETWCEVKIVHTGQHYDPLLSDIFFEQLNLPQPHFYLKVGSGSHSEQTGKTMIAYEQLCQVNRPDVCIVAGDVNATLACTLAAKKCSIPVAHVEAGLRSFDRTMPEEINRIVVDRICDLHLTPSEDADLNLIKEGVSKDSIKRVGNVMIDSLESMRSENKYSVLTLHRPVNVDHIDNLGKIFSSINSLSIKSIFPIHPRTKQIVESTSWDDSFENIQFINPLPYTDFIRLIMGAKFAITDSGGIQEETTYLNIPCLTLRETTERPITVTCGTNQLVSLGNLEQAVKSLSFRGTHPHHKIPLWDGKTSERIVNTIKEYLGLS